MTTYNTGNPIGSKDPRDLYDNAENLDVAVNDDAATWVDRLGVQRSTLWQMLEYSKQFNDRGDWHTSTAYARKDYFTYGGVTYVTLTAHTSTSVAADLAAGKIGVMSGNSGAMDFLQAGTGAVKRSVESKLRDVVSVLDFIPSEYHADIKAGTSSYDCTTAINTAIDSLPNGGAIYFPRGAYLTTGIVLEQLFMSFFGDGPRNSVIKGSNSGAATITLKTGSAFSNWRDLTIDGGEVKSAALITDGDTSSHTFSNVRFTGGTTNTICLGASAGSPDVADSSFVSCVIQSNNATQGQLKIRGNNTSGNHCFGGRISTGSSLSGNAVDIDDGAEFSFFGTNFLALTTDYAIKAASGTIKVYGGHCESGGFMRTIATDVRRDSSTQPHAIYNVSMAVGFGSGLPAIEHLAYRTMIIQGGYVGDSDIVIGNYAKVVANGVSMAGGTFDVAALGQLLVGNSGSKSNISGQAGNLNVDEIVSRKSTASTLSGRSIDVNNETPQPLIGINQDTGYVQIGGGSGALETSLLCHIGNYPAGSLGAGSAAKDGVIAIDNTNKALVFFTAGKRYRCAGVEF